MQSEQRTAKSLLNADRAPQSTGAFRLRMYLLYVCYIACFVFCSLSGDQAPNRPRRSAKADNALVDLRIAGPEGGSTAAATDDDEFFVLLFAVPVLGPAVLDLAERG